MSGVKALNDMAELQRSGFGQPSPRHGLRLLYWFLNACVEVNPRNRMISLCSSSAGDFGFRIFHNRGERGRGPLLPDSGNLPYYELGNLSVSGAKSLPEYVREKYTGFQDKSNTDRIIVSLDSGTVRSIYVTRHVTRLNFDPSHTFCIGLELVRTIKNLQREDFLRAAKRRRNIRSRCDTTLRTEEPERNDLTPLSTPLTPHPHSQELHPHAAPRLRLHPHEDTRRISDFC
ncbi:interferon-inducible Gig1, partial [Clarias magur]